MSAAAALKTAIYLALRADSALAALLATHAYESPSGSAVYEFVPQPDAPESAAEFPFVVIGDFTATEFDTDDVDGQEHTVVVHVFDRYEGSTRVAQVQDAIYNALHEAALSVAGQHVVYCLYEFSGSVPDPDPDRLTQHGVIRFRIVTQES